MLANLHTLDLVVFYHPMSTNNICFLVLVTLLPSTLAIIECQYKHHVRTCRIDHGYGHQTCLQTGQWDPLCEPAHCEPGYTFQSKTHKCEPCPVGTYKEGNDLDAPCLGCTNAFGRKTEYSQSGVGSKECPFHCFEGCIQWTHVIFVVVFLVIVIGYVLCMRVCNDASQTLPCSLERHVHKPRRPLFHSLKTWWAAIISAQPSPEYERIDT